MIRPKIAVDELPSLPRDAEGPVFREPWEAQAFALAVRLYEAGAFTWAEWSQSLAAEIRAAQARGDRDLGDTYYRHWLAALETLLERKGTVPEETLRRRTEEWRRAYLRTPHGRPVALRPAARDKR